MDNKELLKDNKRLTMLVYQYCALLDALNETMFELEKHPLYSNIIKDARRVVGVKQDSISE